MGVSGLLPLLKSIHRPTQLEKFNGVTLGVDAYGWLHRAAYCCALELGQDKSTTKYVQAVMRRVKMLRQFGVMPYMVFDGDYLPSKAATEDLRASRRAEKKKLAMELLAAGKSAQAVQEFQKCIDITPEMALAVIQQLKKLQIPYLVAPYEADAQLVYLERHGHVSGILSDDSDLLVFGAKRLLTKLDQYGNCIEINRKDFCACREVSLTGWTDTDFRRMAILSGCDYLESLPGVGLKTAYRMLRKSKTPERVVRMLRLEGKTVSENYLVQFYQAELTFLHQWVFCPVSMQLVHLTDLDGTRTADEMPYIGSWVEPELSRAIARGDVNPITKTPMAMPTTPSKRRHSQTATTVTAQPPRKHSQTATTVAAQPPRKPIHSYFAAHNRLPMGEMDPNCFSVDPQQVSQITEHGLVPRVFPLPRPYLENDADVNVAPTASRRTRSGPARTSPRLQRRCTEPISSISSRNSTSRSSTLPSAHSPAGPPTRPPKKARLCDEEDDAGSPQKSKFFPDSTSKSRLGRAKSDAYLLSDDSIEEALRNLPDIDGWASFDKPAKPIAIFNDATPQKSVNSTSTIPSLKAQTQAIKKQKASDASGPLALTGDAKARLRRLPSSTSLGPNLDRFAFSPGPSLTPATSGSRRSSIFSDLPTPSTAPSTVGTRLTPLQRLGLRAINNAASPLLPKPRPAAAQKMGAAAAPNDPCLVPLPKVDLEEVEALNKTCGSEDLLMPHSDVDGADEVEEPPKALNLSRFAYSAVQEAS